MKYYLSFILLLCNIVSYAQRPAADDNTKPVKLSELVAAYGKSSEATPDDDEGADEQKPGEGEDYQFDRWLWYAKQHTDKDGYVVSPVKTYNEWGKYIARSIKQLAKTTGNDNWQFDGPTISFSGYGGIGRVNVMAFHPTNANTYMVGTAGGGVWKTTNNGQAWICLTDALPALSVSDLDINPLNPNTIYLCTGDGDGRSYYSIGILKSTNGGITWDTTGINWNESSLRYTNSLVINKLDTNCLVMAASDGIYKSTNGGTNWVMVKPGYFKQVMYSPADTNVLYATSYYTIANATPAQIFRSANGGLTWTQVTNLSTSWRITLATTAADAKIVKAIVCTYNPANYRGLLGIYNSTDTGKNFQQIYSPTAGCQGNLLCGDLQGNTCGGQGNYDLAMTINPANANQVYMGGVNSYYSANGGSSWQMITQWYHNSSTVADVHADKHYLAFHPLVANRMFECNDGGLYVTNNPASTQWTDLSNGLAITQFYRNAVTSTTADVLGGAQDNGTKMGTNGNYNDLTGGDGMECQIDNNFPNLFVTGVQYGIFYASTDGGNSFMNISNNIPGNPTGAWITPLTIHPLVPGMLIAGYKEVYASLDIGQTWSSISPTFPKNLLRVSMTPADSNTIYVVEDSSTTIHYTFNFGATWNNLTAPYGTSISDLKVDARDKTHFWITLTGYGADKVAEYKQGNWTAMNTNLPDLPVNCIEQDSSNGNLYIGTDVAVFYRSTSMTQWALYNNHLPAVRICDLGINYGANQIWAATYGRGMWYSAKEGTGGVDNKTLAGTVLQVYPNPSKDVFTINGFNRNALGKPIEIKAIDNNGKTVWLKTMQADNTGSLHINMNGLTPGNYTIVTSTSNIKIASVKVVVE